MERTVRRRRLRQFDELHDPQKMTYSNIWCLNANQCIDRKHFLCLATTIIICEIDSDYVEFHKSNSTYEKYTFQLIAICKNLYSNNPDISCILI